MANQTVEERLADLEAKVARLQEAKGAKSIRPASWLDLWYGAFQDNPDYDAAMERGAEYRRSQPTADEEQEEHDLPA